MAYQALYRAFRPRQFSDLVGQEVVARTLRNALKNGRLAHAYMFNGPRGTGKTSTALILAKAANCLDLQEGEPCGECANCRAFAEGSLLDVVEIDAASNRGIDEMRQLREQVRFVPSMGLRKVYIIDEVHMLTTEAFNALLKTLEEPPAHALFILATTDAQRVPATVASRTQRFDFRRIPDALVIEQLGHVAKAEDVALTDEAARHIARAAAGGLRDALSLLDQAMALGGRTVTETDIRALVGGIDDAAVARLLEAIAAGDYPALLAEHRAIADAGADGQAVLECLADAVRALFLARVEPSRDDPAPLAAPFRLRTLEAFLRAIDKGLLAMRQSPDRLAVLEVTLLDLALLQSEAALPSAPAATAATAPARPSATTAPAASPSQTPATAVAPPAEPAESPPATSAPSAANAPATPAPAPVPSSGDLARQWPAILAAIKKENVLVHAYLLPARIEDDTIVFPAANGFHYRQMQRREYLELLGRLIGELTGDTRPPRLHLIEEAPEDRAQDDIVSQSIAIFGEDKVHIIDQ